MKKGFLFSLDAMLMLGIVFFLFAMIFVNLSNLNPYELAENELIEYSWSIAAVMEMQGALGENDIDNFLTTYTRNETCFHFDVYDSANVLEYNVTKTDCENYQDVDNLFQVKRSFYRDNKLRIVRVYGWYQ